MNMTLEEQGAYRNLLDEAHLRGGLLPADERILAKACGDALAWSRVRSVVIARFEKVESGYRNITLDAVLKESVRRAEKQRNYRDRRENAANASLVTGNGHGNSGSNAGGSPDPDPDPDPDLGAGAGSVIRNNKLVATIPADVIDHAARIGKEIEDEEKGRRRKRFR